MSEKRYYWLKIKSSFFSQKEIKKLRRIAGGDTYTIIYLKMQLKSLENGGKLYYEGVDEDFESEIALDIDEDVENVRVTISFLKACKLIEMIESDEYLLHAVEESIGTETAGAVRVRRHRERKALLSNDTVTEVKRDVNAELELELELELEKDKEKSNRIDFFFQYWNEKGLPNIRYNSLNLPNAIQYLNYMRMYSDQEIRHAIDNYCYVFARQNNYTFVVTYPVPIHFFIKGIGVYTDDQNPRQRNLKPEFKSQPEPVKSTLPKDMEKAPGDQKEAVAGLLTGLSQKLKFKGKDKP